VLGCEILGMLRWFLWGNWSERNSTVFVLQNFKSWFFITGSCFTPHADITDAVVGKAIVVIHTESISSGTAIGNNCITNLKVIVEYDGVVEKQRHLDTGATINVGLSLGESSFIKIHSKDHEPISLVILRGIGMGVTVLHGNISKAEFLGD
jgi:UDP-3-O-[3-hydroxymyristoyl] glucosamine N-acyltransferase